MLRQRAAVGDWSHRQFSVGERCYRSCYPKITRHPDGHAAMRARAPVMRAAQNWNISSTGDRSCRRSAYRWCEAVLDRHIAYPNSVETGTRENCERRFCWDAGRRDPGPTHHGSTKSGPSSANGRVHAFGARAPHTGRKPRSCCVIGPGARWDAARRPQPAALDRGDRYRAGLWAALRLSPSPRDRYATPRNDIPPPPGKWKKVHVDVLDGDCGGSQATTRKLQHGCRPSEAVPAGRPGVFALISTHYTATLGSMGPPDGGHQSRAEEPASGRVSVRSGFLRSPDWWGPPRRPRS